jgi:hypothetical protein
MTWIGIDLGASTIHAVVIEPAGPSRARLRAARTFAADDVAGLVGWARGTAVVAIDAPAGLSQAPHRHDPTLAPKFASARCGEIALGQQLRIWVPWTTPADPAAVPGWMHVGFAVWDGLQAAGHTPVEVYPAGVFQVLAGARPPKKTTRAGLAARIALLAAHLELPEGVEMWSHDGIDALAAAVVARGCTVGTARAVGHDGAGCDGSAIWVPEPDGAR